MDRLRILEKPALTERGIELSVVLSRHSRDEEGNIFLTSSCVTAGEFSAEINGLIASLEQLRSEANAKFESRA